MSVKKTDTQPATLFAFHSLANNQKYLSVVQKVFKDLIEPIYGDQTRALRKIREGRDRKCEVLTRDDTAVGILVYKRKTQNEYTELHLKKSMEIKTLMVIDPAKNSGQGLGSRLLKRAHRVAIQMLASTIHVTVSEAAKQAKAFFIYKKFKVLKTWADKYKVGVNEYLLAIKVPSRLRRGDAELSQTNITQSTRTTSVQVKRKRLNEGQTPCVEEESRQEKRKKIKLERCGVPS